MHTKFKIAGAAVIGRNHESKGIPLQDKVFSFRSKNQKEAIIALADGAGSCAYSHIGAEIVTSKIGNIILNNFEDIFKDLDWAKSFIYEKLLKFLQEYTLSKNVNLNELASTLLFSVVKEKKKEVEYIAGHIGDGIIIKYEDGNVKILSYPDNYEFSNYTFFVTSNDTLEHFRIYRGKFVSDEGFILISDGTAKSLYKKTDKSLAPACNLIFKWCDSYRQNTVSKVLKSNLQNIFRLNTFDDCSIAILKRMKKRI